MSKGIDSNYIISFNDKLLLKTFSSAAKTFLPYDLPRKLPKIDFTTNSFLTVGFGFSYKWFGLRYGFNVLQIGNPALFDKTSNFDIYLNIYLPKHIVDIMVTEHKGFYNSNPSANIKQWRDTTKTPPKPSNLRTLMIGANYLYVFNGDKFSFKSTFTQSEQQIKSSGSFLLGTSFNFFSIHADSSLIPKDYINKDSLTSADEFLNGEFIGPSIRFGYGYNFIIYKNLSILAAVTPGISIEYNKYINSKGKINNSVKSNFQSNFRLGITYSKPSYFFGLNAFNDLYFHNLREADFLYTTMRLEFFFGIRIAPFHFMAPKSAANKTIKKY